MAQIRPDNEYVVALIPLGGYVKMLDGRVDELTPELKTKLLIVNRFGSALRLYAGPLANFIFALFALYLMYLAGVPG